MMTKFRRGWSNETLLAQKIFESRRFTSSSAFKRQPIPTHHTSLSTQHILVAFIVPNLESK